MTKKRPHDERMGEISKQLTPRRLLNDPIFNAAMQRNMEMDIAARKHLREVTSKVKLLVYATLGSSSGLRIAEELRRFWFEYFERFMHYGLEALPSSFNILEAFVFFNKDLLTFVLRREKEHILAFSHYLDWYTAGSFPEEPGSLVDIMEEGLCYSYDFVLSSDQPLLSAGTSKLAIASTALIRHQDELSILVLAGEAPPLEAKKPHGISAPGKEELVPNAELAAEDRLLAGAPGFSRVILATRFNLSNCSNDVRYLLLDKGWSYDIATDDFQTIHRSFFRNRQDPRSRALKEAQLADLARYADLFSAAASLMYLPAFFISHTQDCNNTEFLTTLGVEAKEPKAKRLRRELGQAYFKLKRTVRCLPAPQEARPPAFAVQPPELEFETRGFWKPLPPGQIGTAADGTAIFGKTWVQRTEAWESTSPAEFLARGASAPEAHSEFIYIARSSSHAVDLYKVGMTTRDVRTRVGELTASTSSPLPFEVLASWPVRDAAAAERRIHEALRAYRVSPRREFFRAPLPTILRVISGLLAERDH